jgi:hypothetical protein
MKTTINFLIRSATFLTGVSLLAYYCFSAKGQEETEKPSFEEIEMLGL